MTNIVYYSSCKSTTIAICMRIMHSIGIIAVIQIVGHMDFPIGGHPHIYIYKLNTAVFVSVSRRLPAKRWPIQFINIFIFRPRWWRCVHVWERKQAYTLAIVDTNWDTENKRSHYQIYKRWRRPRWRCTPQAIPNQMQNCTIHFFLSHVMINV